MQAKKSPSILGRIAYFGTFLAIFATAIPEGTTEPWHKGVFVVSISVFAMLRVADGLVNSEFGIVEPRLLLPLIGILILAMAQLLPISAGHPVSLDPYQTQSFIVVFGCLIICAEILFNFTRSATQLRYLVGLVLTIALGSSVFGLIRHLLASSGVDLFLQSEHGYAQFAYRNHFALLAEMGLGLLIGILLKGGLRYELRLLGWIACAVLVYSMIAASSRGGLVSLTGIAIVAVFVHVMTRSRGTHDSTPRNGSRYWAKLPTKIITAAIMCLLTVGIIVFLVAFIGGDAVVTRIEDIDREIGTIEQTRVNRATIWTSTLEMVRERPLLGSGFGAYGAAITKYDRSNGHFLLEQAHNDYLEIIANGGVISAILFAVFAILVGARMFANLRSSEGFQMACCFGAIISVVGVLIHSFVDFGLHVLVNALVFVALIVIGTARFERSFERPRRERVVRTRRQ